MATQLYMHSPDVDLAIQACEAVGAEFWSLANSHTRRYRVCFAVFGDQYVEVCYSQTKAWIRSDDWDDVADFKPGPRVTVSETIHSAEVFNQLYLSLAS